MTELRTIEVPAEAAGQRLDQYLAAQLEGVSLTRLRADDGDAPGERLEQRPRLGDCIFRAGNHNPQLPGRSHAGPAKDRRRYKLQSAAGVLGGEPLTERHADGAAGDVQHARRKRVHQSVRAEQHLFIRGIVKEHRDYGVCAQFSLSRSGRGDCAFADQRFRAPFGPVPHCQFVPGLQQPARHRRPHLPRSQKTYPHGHNPSQPAYTQRQSRNL